MDLCDYDDREHWKCSAVGAVQLKIQELKPRTRFRRMTAVMTADKVDGQVQDAVRDLKRIIDDFIVT